jgi:hypothetical protein
MKHLFFSVSLLLYATLSNITYAQVEPKDNPSNMSLQNCKSDSQHWPLTGLSKLIVNVMRCENPNVIWVMAKRLTPSGYEVTESPHFKAEYLSANGIGVYDAHSFTVAFLDSRSMVTPINYEYAFTLKHGVWPLLSASFDGTQACDDESIGDGSAETINFLSGKVHVDEREKCKLDKSLNTSQKPVTILLKQFIPSDLPF